MRKLFVVLLLSLSVNAHAATWFNCVGDTLCGSAVQPVGGEWGPYATEPDIGYQSDSPTGNPGVWRITFLPGIGDGAGVGNIWPGNNIPAHTQEIWVQYWWKYSPGFVYEGVSDKQFMYFANNESTVAVTMEFWSGNGATHITGAPRGMAYPPNVDTSLWYQPVGSWHKYKGHMKWNTPNVRDGIYEAWVDDRQIANWTNVYYGDTTAGFDYVVWAVTYGGRSTYLPNGPQYLYWAGMYLGSTDPGGSVVTDTVPPYVYGTNPPEGSTGNDNTNRNIVAHVADGGSVVSNVQRSSVTMGVSINGGAYTTYSYGSGLTFSPNTSNSADFTITRTMGTDFAVGDMVNIRINATDVAGNVMSQKAYSFSIAPATGGGTAKTKAQVLAYLAALPNQAAKKILTGQSVGWCGVYDEFGHEYSDLGTIYGHYPGYIEGNYTDFDGLCTTSEGLITYGNSLLVTHWNNGGLVGLSENHFNPVTMVFDKTTEVNLDNVYTPGNAVYDNWRLIMDRIAVGIQDLQDNGVVVIFRPLGEMNKTAWVSGQAWWTGKDPTQYVNLWRYTHDYFTITKGLTNILWHWAPQLNGSVQWPASPWYPGSSYVDVVGWSQYPPTSTGRITSQSPYYESYMLTLGKPFVLSEYGICSGSKADCPVQSNQYTIGDIQTYYPNAVYFNQWNDWWAINYNTNVSSLLNDPRVINRDDNPSGAAGAAASITITTTVLPNGTVGSAYSQQLQLAAIGGQSPYTWSLISGSLPAGLSLSTSGVISGVPTTAATSSFTVRVTDVNSVTDDQALSIIVESCLPGGCGVTVTGLAFTDTYIISGSGADTNYGTSTTVEAYQWPAATVANRIILVNSADISALPDNIAITSAKVRLYMTGYEGSGGTNPMRVHAKSISGTLPDPATVTWTSFAGTLSSDLSVADVSLVPGWFEWDVTSYVAAQYANSKAAVYLALDGASDGASDTNRIFASVNNATVDNRPQLVIVYTQLVGPGGPSISAPGKIRVTKMIGTFR